MSKFKHAEPIDKAIILYIKYLVEGQFGNTDQTELKNNPFENTGGEIIAISEDFNLFNLHIKAYDWNKEKDGYLKFYFRGDLVVEFKWYKHCLRGLEVKYIDSNPEEVCELITDLLTDSAIKIEEK